ncbi:hypothetical protein BL253_33565 [Pseudofrankia asymbiotica]|uniref:HTH araC/xylS-type domain-containing protein n=1 Tax=Pseudofrankia asymbiotica TaxID=1834516 RepID=A0A1V2I1C3_9ACTN|nr:hypothetical protein BL253_33565 [Pseudofrankia asymbiotica]
MTHPAGAASLPIEAGWDQLLYAASGVMTVSTLSGSWTVPPLRAVWIPDSERATVSNRSPVAVRGLFLDSSLGALPAAGRAMNMPRFCRELLLHTVGRCPLDLGDTVQAALLTVLLDQLRSLPDAPLWLPRPIDPRAADFAAAAAADPSIASAELARRVGAGLRTLERLFIADTGLGVGAWRRRCRILGSFDALAAGASVTVAGMSAGYATPSAFVAAFKRELGVTPRRFLAP